MNQDCREMGRHCFHNFTEGVVIEGSPEGARAFLQFCCRSECKDIRVSNGDTEEKTHGGHIFQRPHAPLLTTWPPDRAVRLELLS